MSPIPQSLTQPDLPPSLDDGTEPFYQNPDFILGSIIIGIILLLITCRLCFLRRSRRPLSEFCDCCTRPDTCPGEQQSTGTQHGPYRTSTIGMQHRPAAAGQNRHHRGSSYAPGGYGKEPLPVYDGVDAPPRYGDPERTTNGRSAVQPSSMDPAAPPPAYQGPQNS
ncbi:hypothetical protein EDD17DRAFT_1534606 [Pisolithus thermaeus]|nr:hypothetical protein EDD17DRAFT_1534606 [Pisolithus thermaeus]